MKNEQEKVSAFAEAVGLEIDHKIHEIERSIKQYREDTIAKTYEQTYDRMFVRMQARVREIKQAQRRQVTQERLQQRRKLILQRNQLVDDLFEQLRKKLAVFTESPDYVAFLARELSQACAADFCYEEVEVRLRPQDMKFVETLQADFTGKDAEKSPCVGKRLVFAPDKTIKLGGFVLWNPRAQVLLDRTLEAKWIEQQQRFREMPDFRMAFVAAETASDSAAVATGSEERGERG